MRIASCIVALLLGGCALVPREPELDLTQAERREQLQQLQDWHVEGRIGFRQGDQAFSASLSWFQQGSGYRASMMGAFGAQAVRLVQSATAATLDYQGRVTSGQDMQTLVHTRLGVHVPFDQLGQWLRGLPGTATDPVYDRHGRLKQLDYADDNGIVWTARISEYVNVDGRELPVYMLVDSDQHEITLRLKNWTLDPAADLDNEAVDQGRKTPQRLKIPGSGS